MTKSFKVSMSYCYDGEEIGGEYSISLNARSAEDAAATAAEILADKFSNPGDVEIFVKEVREN